VDVQKEVIFSDTAFTSVTFVSTTVQHVRRKRVKMF